MAEKLTELEAAIDKARAGEDETPVESENTGPDYEAKFVEMQATIEGLRKENTELQGSIGTMVGGKLAEMETEYNRKLAEIEKRVDEPTSRQESALAKMSAEELESEPGYADYLIWRQCVEQKDRENPGYAKRMYAKVEIRETEAGLLGV